MRTIPEGLLDEIVCRLVDEFQPERIFLFGSHAWGTLDDDSDIDLMVIVSASDERPVDRSIRGARRLGDLMFAKDVFVKTRAEFERYTHLKATLQYKILHEGRVLYGPSTDRDRWSLDHESGPRSEIGAGSGR